MTGLKRKAIYADLHISRLRVYGLVEELSHLKIPILPGPKL